MPLPTESVIVGDSSRAGRATSRPARTDDEVYFLSVFFSADAAGLAAVACLAMT